MRMRSITFVLFCLLLAAVELWAQPGQRLGCGFEWSGNLRDNQIRKALESTLKGEGLSLEAGFDYVTMNGKTFYLLAGDEFVFVDISGPKKEHYVSPLFSVESGKISVLWSIVRRDRKVFFIAYSGKSNDGRSGDHSFFLEVTPPQGYCNDVFGLEEWKERATSQDPESAGYLTDLRFVDIDNDGRDEMLCSLEIPDSSGKSHRELVTLRQEETSGGATRFVAWKPDHFSNRVRKFFDSLR